MAIKIFIDQGHNSVNPNAGAEANPEAGCAKHSFSLVPNYTHKLNRLSMNPTMILAGSGLFYILGRKIDISG